MSTASRTLSLSAALLATGALLPAHGALSVAKDATQNMSCTGGRCVATAADAVMNVRELRHLLASQKRVVLEAGPAKSIVVDAPLSWTSSNTLELKARHALTVNKPVTVAGAGGVTIQTEDGGLSFAPKASLSFWNLASKLAINGVSYTLVGDIKSIAWQVSTPVALAGDYDASVDGQYYDAPVQFIESPNGRLEGLGHTISHLTVNGGGLVGQSNGTLTNLHLANASVFCGRGDTGIAVGENYGLFDHVSVSGVILTAGGCASALGGLVGQNQPGGIVRNSSARIRIPVGGYQTGGLVAVNAGTISNSWVDGTVRGMGTPAGEQGALVGINGGTIENSYSLADTRFCSHCEYDAAHGGLIGETSTTPNYPSKVVSSYAAGRTALPRRPWLSTDGCSTPVNLAGAVVGCDGDNSSFASTYWVTDSRHSAKTPAGNKNQLAGVTGLTEAQLKSTLPPGFDSHVWGQNPAINNGYPYLLSNPPQ